MLNLSVAEYWIIRRSLSSGGHSADPLADDDSFNWGTCLAPVATEPHTPSNCSLASLAYNPPAATSEAWVPCSTMRP